MNIIVGEWQRLTFEEKMDSLSWDVWRTLKLWANEKAHSRPGEQASNGITHTAIIAAVEGENKDMDRFRMVEMPEAATCECTYCTDELSEGTDVLNTGYGVFCDYKCFGRWIAQEEGYKKGPLTADMVG